VLSMPRCAWDVYYAARRARWVGRVQATSADAAAVEFKTDAWKLIAVRAHEIS
jgi:hypothetical protein